MQVVVNSVFTAKKLEHFQLFCLFRHLQKFGWIHNPNDLILVLVLNECGDPLSHEVKIIDLIINLIQTLPW